MDVQKIVDGLNYYIRPASFPLAIRMCESPAEIPEKARRPLRGLGFQMAICQAIGIGRRYGWTLALTREDHPCPFGSLAMGFERPKEAYLDGSFLGFSPASAEVAAKTAEAVKRFPHGKYHALLISPLHRAYFEPEVIVVYGDSAQVMRLVQARLANRGGSLSCAASGIADCSDIIVRTSTEDECQVILPCNGDRVFGMTGDHEMIFTMPAQLADNVVAGLETTHRIGQRYPIPTFMRFQPEFPEGYNKLMGFLKEEED